MNSLWLLSYVTIIAVAAVVTFINVTIQTRGVHSSGTAHIKPQGVTVRTECHSGCLVGVFFFPFSGYHVSKKHFHFTLKSRKKH